MKIDEKIIKNSGQAGIIVGISLTIIMLAFALIFGQQQEPFRSINPALFAILPSLFYTILSSIFVSVILSVIFGVLFFYIPTKKVLTKYFIFRFIILAIASVGTVLFGLPTLFQDISVEAIFELASLLLSVIIFAYSFDKFSKIEQAKKEQELASIKRRVLATIIDFLAIGLVCLLIFGIMVFGSTKENETLSGITETFKKYALLLFVCWSLYWPFCEFFFQQTIGKIILGIEVKKEDGTKIGLKESFTRNLSKMMVPMLGIIPLTIDSVALLKSKRKQKIFDIVAGTIVAKKENEKQPREERPKYLSQR